MTQIDWLLSRLFRLEAMQRTGLEWWIYENRAVPLTYSLCARLGDCISAELEG